MPGVTRDTITREVERDGYTIVDTGGMGLVAEMSDTPEIIVSAVEEQIAFSISAADLILMVVDGREGLVPLDIEMSDTIRKSSKPVMLVVNKVDKVDSPIDVNEHYSLGLGEPLLVSAEHDRGISRLREEILKKRVKAVGPVVDSPIEFPEKRIRVCFLGRPNVGKSSLSNCLVKSDRFIVSDVPGTTRDSIETSFTWKSKRGEDWRFTLTDTAGIRKKTKLSSSVEYFSRVRSLDSIQNVDVVFMVVDAEAGPTHQDKAIAGEASKLNKPIVIVVNKWDLPLKAWEKGEIEGFETESEFRKAFEKGLRREIFFTPGSPVRFVSAIENIDIEKMLYDARQLDKRSDKEIPTGRLNNLIYKIAERMPAPKMDGRRFRVYYAVHAGNRPYRIKLFCNQAQKLAGSYRRFLQASIVEAFKLEGCPVVFDLVNKKNPYVKED
tara:strand:+ start:532 stop:1845 length:1314 start_codon:yes stop_codon:yes gene_type:complete